MYNQINADTLTSAGQFALSDIQLISYVSAEGGSEPKKVSVRSQVIEINIYEDLFGKGLTGNIVMVDGQNIANHLPLTGFERIEFKLNTPGISKGFDFTSVMAARRDRQVTSPRRCDSVFVVATKSSSSWFAENLSRRRS